MAKHLPVSEGPLLDFIRLRFTSPSQVAEAVAKRSREMGEPRWSSQSEVAPRAYATPLTVFEGPIDRAPLSRDSETATDPDGYIPGARIDINPAPPPPTPAPTTTTTSRRTSTRSASSNIATSHTHLASESETDPISARSRSSTALESSAYDSRPTSGEFIDYEDDGVESSVFEEVPPEQDLEDSPPVDPRRAVDIQAPGLSHDELSSDHSESLDIRPALAPPALRQRGRKRPQLAPDTRPTFVDDIAFGGSNLPDSSRRRLAAVKQQPKLGTASVHGKSKQDEFYKKSLRGVCYFGLNYIIYCL